MPLSSSVGFFSLFFLQRNTEESGQETVTMYRMADIASHPALRLQSSDLLLIALLAGGDYSVSNVLLIVNSLLTHRVW